MRDVAFLLARGADIDYRDWALKPPLWLAAYNGHVGTVTLLLDEGAGDAGGGLNYASIGGHLPVVALMLDRGVDVHHQNDAALQNAAFYGRDA